MISPFKIKWRSYSSLDFDVWTELAFGQGDSGETETFLSKEAVVSESYDGSIKRAYGYKYTESPTFTLTFIKKNYDDFTRDENRKILAWLTGSKSAGFIDVYTTDSERPEFCCLGNFISVNQYKMGNSRIVGYTAEFESLTPYCFSPLWSVTSMIPCFADKTEPLSVYRWKAHYNSTNAGPQYLYTLSSHLTLDTAMLQYMGDESNFTDTGLIPWERIVTITDGATYTTTGGYTMTLEADGIYNLDKIIGGTDFILDVHTDDLESPIYPKITIQLNSNGNIIETSYEPTEIADGIVYYYRPKDLYFWKDDKGRVRSANSNLSGITDSNITISNAYTDADGKTRTVTSKIVNNIKGETIVLDGANKVVSSDREGRIFGDDFDWNWIPLMNGKNTFSVLANCTVTVEWREPIKVGQYC